MMRELANKLFAELAQKEIYITPTLYIGKVLSNLADEDHSSDSLLNKIGEGIQKTYERRLEAAKKAKSSGSQMREKVIHFSQANDSSNVWGWCSNFGRFRCGLLIHSYIPVKHFGGIVLVW